MKIILVPFLGVLHSLLDLYYWAVLVYTLLSLLISWNIVNSFNRVVFSLVNFLANIIEPFLIRIRSVLPVFSQFDLSPLVLILIIVFLKNVLALSMEALY